MTQPAPYDLAPLLAIMAIGALLAAVPFAWVWRRDRAQGPAARLRALTVLTLFLTFDLVLFGAFTRLTDSGLGCPDWPGCYASTSPLGAAAEIGAAQAALPTGPVTPHKAWIEMIHRYLATGVGAMVALLVVMSWIAARRQGASRSVFGLRSASLSVSRPVKRPVKHLVTHLATRPISPWWATATLVWVGVQGAFGALTVTMKLQPAIVTAHLLGGLGLLALLAVQKEAYRATSVGLSRRSWPHLSPRLHAAALVLAAASVVQIALGGWVSTNYAVLACTDFPTCHGSWWPVMDFDHGFALMRDLGKDKDGGYLSFAALTAIHYVHRLGAYAVLLGMAAFAVALRMSEDRTLHAWSRAVAAVAAWQLLSGLSNVVLGWPLIGAVAHTAGAAAWVVLMTTLLVRARRGAAVGQPQAARERQGGAKSASWSAP